MNTATKLIPFASEHHFPTGLLTHVTALADESGEVYVISHHSEIATSVRVQDSNLRSGVSEFGFRVSDGRCVRLHIAAGEGYFPNDGDREVSATVEVFKGTHAPTKRETRVTNAALRALGLYGEKL